MKIYSKLLFYNSIESPIDGADGTRSHISRHCADSAESSLNQSAWSELQVSYSETKQKHFIFVTCWTEQGKYWRLRFKRGVNVLDTVLIKDLENKILTPQFSKTFSVLYLLCFWVKCELYLELNQFWKNSFVTCFKRLKISQQKWLCYAPQPWKNC